MLVTIYSKPGCKYCDYAKQLFERANVVWEEIVCEGIDADKLTKDYPNANTYPHIIIDNEVIGGLTEAAKYLLQKGLVESHKK